MVDKSVELLNPNGDSFSLEALFSAVQHYEIAKWRGTRVNDYKYCKDKLGTQEEGIVSMIVNLYFAAIITS